MSTATRRERATRANPSERGRSTDNLCEDEGSLPGDQRRREVEVAVPRPEPWYKQAPAADDTHPKLLRTKMLEKPESTALCKRGTIC